MIKIKVKQKKCCICCSKYEPRSSTQTVCGFHCAKILADKVAENRKKAIEKIERKTIKDRKEKLKSRSDHLKDAQKAFNAFIRARDQAAGHTCISCQAVLDWTGNLVDAGHYRSTGSAPHMRFDENNVHAQCKKCNMYRAGNAVDYRIVLIKRIGIDAVERLENDNTSRKYTIDDLIKIKEEYRKKKALIKVPYPYEK